MKELTLFGENPIKEDERVMLKVKDDTIGLATSTTKEWCDQFIEVKLSRDNISKLTKYLVCFLYEKYATKCYLVDEDGKYLNIDGTGYIGFGEKESKYKNTFTDNEIIEYDLSHWIYSCKLKKVLA